MPLCSLQDSAAKVSQFPKILKNMTVTQSYAKTYYVLFINPTVCDDLIIAKL